VQRNAVVGPDRLDFEAERVADPSGHRHCPRRVHPGAERGQDAEAPVADLVAEALDHHDAVGRHDPGRGLLLPQKCQQVRRSSGVQPMLLAEALERLLVGEAHQLP
jgi:hypothetical protein